MPRECQGGQLLKEMSLELSSKVEWKQAKISEWGACLAEEIACIEAQRLR